MKPFLHGRKANAKEPLRAPHVHRNAPLGRVVAPPSAASPHVEVVKEGEKVVRIVVTCSCGERTEIECLYPANG
ncbi:MAG: hypothetical protein NDI75_13490 [Candidatus Didemnitutus sp.]|nr:hypothetical protein [Candidatus Didemnitutus sp.]